MAVFGVAFAAGCGGGSRQDLNEPAGKFPADVVSSKFPARQKLAETTQLRLGVKNTGERTIPNLAITVYTNRRAEGSFLDRSDGQNLADPNRPVWILESGYPQVEAPRATGKEKGIPYEPAGGGPTSGAATAYNNTFAFGALKPGQTRVVVWRVTAVKAGTHTVTYKVAAGLSGKAKAVGEDGATPGGKFVVTISGKAPNTRVSDSGRVVRR